MEKNDFNEIYIDLVPRLTTFLKNGWKLTNEDIEEIIHDVLMTLHSKTLTPLFKWNKSWVYRTTYNKAIDKQRSKKDSEESLSSDPISKYLTPEEELLNNDQRKWINDFLNILNDIDRKIAYLHYFENFSCKKLEHILNIPNGTIKYKLFNIRKKLKEEYTINEER